MKDVEDRSKYTTPERLVNEFAERLPEGGKVLDAGCGTGYLSRTLSERGFEVVSVDPKGHRIEYGRKKERFQEARATTVEAAKFPESSFDGVIAVEVIEHIDKPGEFLSELKRILKQEGVVAIKTPNRATHDIYQVVFERNLQLLKGGEIDFHPSVMMPRQLLKLMEREGFDAKFLKPEKLPENQKRKLGGLSKIMQPLNFRLLPQFLQPTLMAIGERR